MTRTIFPRATSFRFTRLSTSATLAGIGVRQRQRHRAEVPIDRLSNYDDLLYEFAVDGCLDNWDAYTAVRTRVEHALETAYIAMVTAMLRRLSTNEAALDCSIIEHCYHVAVMSQRLLRESPPY
jgi:hypothetical protein